MGIKIKNNGIVRKIDELGRIVIPKEYRKTLNIRDGENIIMSVNNGEIIISKYSLFKDYIVVLESLLETVKLNFNKKILVTDRDEYVLVLGGDKKEYLGKSISQFLEKTINKKQSIYKNVKENLELLDDKTVICEYIIEPISYFGDIIGLLILISENESVSEKDVKLVEFISVFLNKYIEK